MTSNEIKKELRIALSEVNITDRARGVCCVYYRSFSDMKKEDGVKSFDAINVFKQLYYKWVWACESLSKEGFDVPKDLFVYVMFLSDYEIVDLSTFLIKVMRWNKVKLPEHNLVKEIQAICEDFRDTKDTNNKS